MRRPTRLFALAVAGAACAGLAAAIAPARAAEDFFVERHGAWSVFVNERSSPSLCYIGSEPKAEKGDYTRRGETYTLVIHRPKEGSTNVVSVRAGYTYKEGSEVKVTVDGETSFELFTSDGHAWARDAATDRKLVEAMRRGGEMVVKGTSSRGTLTTDTYSLMGFTAAHKAIDEACGVK